MIAVKGVERDREPGEVDELVQSGALLVASEKENSENQGSEQQKKGKRFDGCSFHPGRVGRDRVRSTFALHFNLTPVADELDTAMVVL